MSNKLRYLALLPVAAARLGPDQLRQLGHAMARRRGVDPDFYTAGARWKREADIPDDVYFRAMEAIGIRRQELTLAGRMQASLLPEEPPSMAGWEITVTWRPAQISPLPTEAMTAGSTLAEIRRLQ